MGDHDDKKGLSEADAALWRQMTRDVERFEGRDYQAGDAIEAESEDPSGGETAIIQKKPTGRSGNLGEGLDRRTEERLRRGQMPIDATLDLHGMRQDEARAALLDFIDVGYNRGHRCVLVITGKGKTGKTSEDLWEARPGVLKQRVPDWLNDVEIKAKILKFCAAQQRHGGEGALYVLLRRKR